MLLLAVDFVLYFMHSHMFDITPPCLYNEQTNQPIRCGRLRDALSARDHTNHAASEQWAQVLSKRLRSMQDRLGDVSLAAADAGADARTQRSLVGSLRRRVAALEVQAERSRDEATMKGQQQQQQGDGVTMNSSTRPANNGGSGSANGSAVSLDPPLPSGAAEASAVQSVLHPSVHTVAGAGRSSDGIPPVLKAWFESELVELLGLASSRGRGGLSYGQAPSYPSSSSGSSATLGHGAAAAAEMRRQTNGDGSNSAFLLAEALCASKATLVAQEASLKAAMGQGDAWRARAQELERKLHEATATLHEYTRSEHQSSNSTKKHTHTSDNGDGNNGKSGESALELERRNHMLEEQMQALGRRVRAAEEEAAALRSLEAADALYVESRRAHALVDTPTHAKDKGHGTSGVNTGRREGLTEGAAEIEALEAALLRAKELSTSLGEDKKALQQQCSDAENDLAACELRTRRLEAAFEEIGAADTSLPPTAASSPPLDDNDDAHSMRSSSQQQRKGTSKTSAASGRKSSTTTSAKGTKGKAKSRSSTSHGVTQASSSARGRAMAQRLAATMREAAEWQQQARMLANQLETLRTSSGGGAPATRGGGDIASSPSLHSLPMRPDWRKHAGVGDEAENRAWTNTPTTPVYYKAREGESPTTGGSSSLGPSDGSPQSVGDVHTNDEDTEKDDEANKEEESELSRAMATLSGEVAALKQVRWLCLII